MKNISKLVITVLMVVVLLLPLYACGANEDNDTNITDPKQLNNKDCTIAVEPSTPPEETLKTQYPNAKIMYVNNAAEGYLMVQENKVDAFAGQGTQARIALHQGLKDIRIIDNSFGEVNNVAAGISANSPIKNAGSLFNEFLNEVKSNGTIDEMFERWVTKSDYTNVEIKEAENPSGTVYIGTTGLCEPYSFYQDDKLCGFDIELALRFGAYAGMTVEFKMYDWAGLIPACTMGKVDYVLSNLFDTPERREEIEFSDPVLTVDYVLMVSGETAKYVKASDLQGQKVACLTGAAFDQIIKPFIPSAQIQYFDNNADQVQALISKKCEAIAFDEPIARLISNQYPELSCLETITKEKYAFVFQKNEKGQKYAAQMNAFLKNLRNSGELKAIENLWLGTDEAKKVVEDYTALPATNGKLVYVVNSEMQPFTYIKDGLTVGYEMDIAVRFCKEYGYALEIADGKFSSIIPGIVTGKYDIASSAITITEERAQSVTFSDPNYYGGVTLLVRTQDMNPAAEIANQGFFESLKNSFNKNFIRESRWKLLARGLLVTIIISAFSALFGSLIGFGLCLTRRTGSKVASGSVAGVVKVIQGIPMVVLLMLLYYVVFGRIDINGIIVAIIGFSLNFGVYVCEMMTMGIGAVDGGQSEAALAIGFTKRQVFTRIVFPQAVRHFLPTYKGELISMIKQTAIVGYIAIEDLTKASDIIRSRTYEAFFPLIVSALIYLIFANLLIALIGLIQRKFDPKKRKGLIKGVVEHD